MTDRKQVDVEVSRTIPASILLSIKNYDTRVVVHPMDGPEDRWLDRSWSASYSIRQPSCECLSQCIIQHIDCYLNCKVLDWRFHKVAWRPYEILHEGDGIVLVYGMGVLDKMQVASIR